MNAICLGCAGAASAHDGVFAGSSFAFTGLAISAFRVLVEATSNHSASLAIAANTAPTLNAQQLAQASAQSPEAQALIAMGSSKASFIPQRQSTPNGSNSGAMKLTFSTAGDGQLKITMAYQMGSDAYRDSGAPTLKFGETQGSGELKNVSLKGRGLTFATSTDVTFTLNVVIGGGETILRGEFIRPNGVFALNDCKKR